MDAVKEHNRMPEELRRDGIIQEVLFAYQRSVIKEFDRDFCDGYVEYEGEKYTIVSLSDTSLVMLPENRQWLASLNSGRFQFCGDVEDFDKTIRGICPMEVAEDWTV